MITPGSSTPRTESPGVALTENLAACNVLVIEDEMLMSTLMLRYLDATARAEGLPTLHTAVLTTGWDLLKKDLGHISVAIVDILLPQITGVDLIRDLRHRFPQMGIVPVSGMATTPMKRALRDILAAGSELVEKPIRKEVFAAAFVKAWDFRQKPVAPAPELGNKTGDEGEVWSVGVTNSGIVTQIERRKILNKRAA